MFFLGIITNGGAKPNIIPEEASMSYVIRTPSITELDSLTDKVRKCFEAAAIGTGCQVKLIQLFYP